MTKHRIAIAFLCLSYLVSVSCANTSGAPSTNNSHPEGPQIPPVLPAGLYRLATDTFALDPTTAEHFEQSRKSITPDLIFFDATTPITVIGDQFQFFISVHINDLDTNNQVTASTLVVLGNMESYGPVDLANAKPNSMSIDETTATAYQANLRYDEPNCNDCFSTHYLVAITTTPEPYAFSLVIGMSGGFSGTSILPIRISGDLIPEPVREDVDVDCSDRISCKLK